MAIVATDVEGAVKEEDALRAANDTIARLHFEKEMLTRDLQLHVKKNLLLDGQIRSAHATIAELAQTVQDTRTLLNACHMIQAFINAPPAP
jgi:hypothetical protein